MKTGIQRNPTILYSISLFFKWRNWVGDKITQVQILKVFKNLYWNKFLLYYHYIFTDP